MGSTFDDNRPGGPFGRRTAGAAVGSAGLARPFGLVDDGEHVARGEDEVLLAVVLDLGAAVLRVDDDVADGHVERHAVAVVVHATRANGETLPSWGFSLAVSGMTMPDAVVVSASLAWTTILSSSGRMFAT